MEMGRGECQRASYRRHERHRELVLVHKVLGPVLVADARPGRLGRDVLERGEEVVERLLRQREALRVVDREARQRAALEQAGRRWRRRRPIPHDRRQPPVDGPEKGLEALRRVARRAEALDVVEYARYNNLRWGKRCGGGR